MRSEQRTRQVQEQIKINHEAYVERKATQERETQERQAYEERKKKEIELKEKAACEERRREKREKRKLNKAAKKAPIPWNTFDSSSSYLSELHDDGQLVDDLTDSNDLTDLNNEYEYEQNEQTQTPELLVETLMETLVEKPEFSNECVICMNAESTHLAVPCGHHCVCHACSELRFDKCPICRSDAEQWISIVGCE